jgi:hypothetical protein
MCNILYKRKWIQGKAAYAGASQKEQTQENKKVADPK